MKLYDLFDMYLEHLTNMTNSTYTYTNIKNYVNNMYKIYFSNMELKDITSLDISNFIKSRKNDGLKDTTLYIYFKRFKTIFNFALNNNFIEKNPCNCVYMKYKYAIPKNLNYSKKYIKQLLKLFKHTKFYTLVLFDLHTGLRKEELLSLKKGNFTYKKILFLNIPQSIYVKSNKTGKTRILMLDLKISIYMAFYLKKLHIQDNLFTFTPHYISNHFKKIFKSKKNKRKLKPIRFADIRHIHASYLLANNKNKAHCIKIVQERLGHSTIIQTFTTYTHVLDKDEKKEIKCLNKI